MMRTHTILPVEVYNGLHESVSIDLSESENFARVSVLRKSWPETGTDVIEFQQFFSRDGESWVFWGGFTAIGGDLKTRDGRKVGGNCFVVSIPFPSAGAQGRKFKVAIKTTLPIETEVLVETGAQKFALLEITCP